jgi:P-type E1-E2 ATPase
MQTTILHGKRPGGRKVDDMLNLNIAGSGAVSLSHLVADFSGTLSVDGQLVDGVAERLNQVARVIQVHILTADTHGTAQKALAGINGQVHILEGQTHGEAKEEYIRDLGAENVIALGNGNNDRKMLAAARIGVAVLLEEGCATAAVQAADLVVKSAVDALDLVLSPKRLSATLRW